MRCKQGDIAILVRPELIDNLGKFVTVIEAVGNIQKGETFRRGATTFVATKSGFFWWCEAQTSLLSCTTRDSFKQLHICDDQLRPIRPSEGQDETLSWKDVPQGEYA